MTSKSRSSILLIAALCTASTFAWSDTLVLRDGQKISGKYKGGTESVVQFELSGQVLKFELSKVESILFSDDPAKQMGEPAPSPKAGQQSSSPTSNPEALRVPSGTRLYVRTSDTIETGKVKEGNPFTVVLDSPVTVDGVTVWPKGTTVYGRVTQAVSGGRLARKALLSLELEEVDAKSGRIPIATNAYTVEGTRQGTAARVAAGALVGGAVEDDRGASKGAMVGGATAILTPGKQISIPGGTLLEFTVSK